MCVHTGTDGLENVAGMVTVKGKCFQKVLAFGGVIWYFMQLFA
jgi:hypothetical protein